MADGTQLTLCGAAVADASPHALEPGRIWMSGYKPNRFARTKAGPIQIRAIAVGSQTYGILIVSADTCLISPRMAADWSQRIAHSINVAPEQIFIITTHTHSGPDLCGLFGGVPPSYARFFRDTAVRTAAAAWKNRTPATLYIGAAPHALGIPRRASKGQEGMENHAVVLQWKNEHGIVATLVNLGCHGVVFPRRSRVLSADLPGAICQKADALIGGVTLFAPRVQGDINPAIPGDDPYEQAGNAVELERLAGLGMDTVHDAVNNATLLDPGDTHVQCNNIIVRERTPASYLFRMPIWSGRRAHPATRLRIPVRRFRISGIEGITVPGEVLTCLGRKWLTNKPDPSLLFSYCGGYMGYLMTHESMKRGGYEPMVSPGPVTALPD